MAKGTKTKPKDDIDELEAELEGLEEVVDEEEEEAPEVEEDEDEEGTDYNSLTIAQLKELCKKRGVVGIAKANKTKLIALLEANDASDDEDEEDDEAEDEEEDGIDLDGMTRAELKEFLAEHIEGFKAKKSQSDDDLRELARPFTASDEDDEEEDDEEEDEEEEEDDTDEYEDMDRAQLKAAIKAHDSSIKFLKSHTDEDLRIIVRALAATALKEAAKKKRGGTKTGKGTQPKQLSRSLPSGKLGANDIAKLAGGKTNALSVRNFLRSEAGKKWPKDASLGRYSFTEQQAKAIVKAMKARPRSGSTK